MRHHRQFLGLAVIAAIGLGPVAHAQASVSVLEDARSAASTGSAKETVGVAPQYGTTHVYVAPEAVNAFVTAFTATFGGQSTPQAVVNVTPTPSLTTSQLIQTPVGTVSLFGFKTPIPFPFGAERTGLLVSDMDAAVTAAREAGADVLVMPFPDPIGRDAVIQWPGGINTQIYWHTKTPNYSAFETVPDNRVYVSPERADAFVASYIAFSGGRVVSDRSDAAGSEIGRPGERFRRVRLESAFGKTVVWATDGHLPFPYGRETTGYEVSDLNATLDRARAAGVEVLVEPGRSDGWISAMVQFPGGYIAEVHAPMQ